MTEHVHEWEEYIAPNYDPPPYIRCKHCKEPMGKVEQLARLNATEKTKRWLYLDLMFRLDPDISLDEVDRAEKEMRDACADILEGK